MKKPFTVHGGDLDWAEKTFGIPKNEILDFSGNVNPLGFPEKAKKLLAENIDLVSVYPDKNYEKLRESIGEYTGAKVENITVGNGSTELISSYIKCANAKKAVILGPAYSEYERELKIAGSSYEYFPLKEEDDFKIDVDGLLNFLKPDVGLFIACNPNNPTGTAINKEQMRRILAHCKSSGIRVMIDETYIEFSENLDNITSIPLADEFDNLFVIRGISKFFAAPGIRLGYGICSNKQFFEELKEKKDPWSVNILAAFAGENIFRDKEFIARTKKFVADEKKKAYAELSTWKNIKFYETQSNFVLLKLLTDKITSGEIFHILIKKKMFVRDASTFTFLDDTFLRFSFLKPEDNENFLRELKKLVE
ncbi:MAG: aminotransferase class I/II-fold pyridoxal phosphate-dependent enzyme [Firmicutes bacterium]|nr:aminotransferase class I/II-fold pyridoxal phosphate-dependent enzyme [Bacillota bacterium]